MEVTIEHQDGATIVLPIGDVDLSNSRDLQTSLRQEMSRRPGLVVVDLAKVSYMDSSGVATLVEAMQIARRQATRLVLCELNDKVRAIFEIAHLDRVFTIVPSRAEAVTP